MTETPIQIKKPESIRAIRKLARQSGQTITDAVTEAVNAELKRQSARTEQDYESRLAVLREISQKFRDLPVVGPRLTDDDLYDEDGLPK